MPIIAIENPWALPIEDVLQAALTVGTVSIVAIATRTGKHYAVNHYRGSVKTTGYTLKCVKPPDEVPDSPVCWDGWLISLDYYSDDELMELVKGMESALGPAREIYFDRPRGNDNFRLVTTSHACSGGGWEPKLDFPEESAEPADIELALYPNPYRSEPLPDLVQRLNKVEGIMGITNRSGAMMRCTNHGILYSPNAALGFDLKGLTKRLDSWGFIVCEESFAPLQSVSNSFLDIVGTVRCNLEDIGVTVPKHREHYMQIM